MFLDANQFALNTLLVAIALAAASVLVFERTSPRAALRLGVARVLSACALLAVFAWTNFGGLQTVFVDRPGVRDGAAGRAKVETHLPFHFHEFFHYYLGAKYFRELGYGGLYDCTGLADAEIAEEDGVPRKIGGYIRNLDDVLRDRPYDAALAHCRDEFRPNFSDPRWASFKNDQRALRRLVPDDWWGGAVFDAGFNPPPSWCVVGSAFANAIPIRVAGLPTYLVATSLDMVLALACFLVLRRHFGRAPAAMAAIFFGANFVAAYGWNGGAFLRYTWVTAVVFGLTYAKRERWLLAGVFFACAACDRIFPAAFGVGAAIPLAVRALRSTPARRDLGRLAMGAGATVVGLVLVSTALFGAASWGTFFSRILAHGDVYYVMHIGLKKVLTFRDWVPQQNFHAHAGLERFHDWNMRLHETWAVSRAIALPLQLFALGGAVFASLRRKPHEAGLLLGITAMFFFSLPANYYYVVAALIPAFLLRAAVTAPTRERRLWEYAVLVGFVVMWLCTLLASRMWGDDIVYNHFICQAVLVFLIGWIGVWAMLGASMPGALPWRALKPAEGAKGAPSS
ncbi:MAG TPA: glycosyltransferase family 87 protein [Polyangiaceae bacterium]|jgi:hypothetical protein